MNPMWRRLMFFMAILAIGLGLLMMRGAEFQEFITKKMSYDQFLTTIAGGNVSELLFLQDGTIRGKFKEPVGNKQVFIARIPKPSYEDMQKMTEELRTKNPEIKVEIEEPKDGNSFLVLFLSWVPLLILMGFMFFFMRMMQQRGQGVMSFGQSRAKLVPKEKKVTFKDVAGVEEAKEELSEIIEFLRNPQKFQKLGARIPRGVLLMGPPGSGKTLLARAVAGEANVPFFTISGSDFVEMFVGVGASRVRDLFEQGKKNAPCIIFVDEIDAVGRHRGTGIGGGHDEREQTLNALLVEMDGFEGNSGVIVVAATNRPDVLDPALLRPGRFDRRVVVPRPDVKGRLEILRVHGRTKPMAKDIDLSRTARGTAGFSGADLENLLNEAALAAARKDCHEITNGHLDEARDKVLMGPERRSAIISEEEKKVTAVHEGGHTAVALKLSGKGADPMHKVTIIPRGMALGVTWQLPEKDRLKYTKLEVEARIAICMGGRVAEEIKFGKDSVSTGAQSDFEQATDLAKKMVYQWGMSELGERIFGSQETHPFLGREMAMGHDLSPETANEAEKEVTRIVKEGRDRAWKILQENDKLLDRIAQELLEKETLELADLERIAQEVKNE